MRFLLIEQMIDSNERVMWRGKPGRLLYTIGNVAIYPFALLWLAFDLIFIRGFFSFDEFSGMGGAPRFLPFFFVIHLIPVWIAVLGPVYRFFAWTRVEYVITTRRIYLQSGLIGRDYKSVELYEVQNLSVNVGVLERMQNRGTIRLIPDVTTGHGDNQQTRMGDRLKHIEKPYEVFNLIKRLALDVTTDTRFPNAFRPGENPGYQTEYKGQAGPGSPEF